MTKRVNVHVLLIMILLLLPSCGNNNPKVVQREENQTADTKTGDTEIDYSQFAYGNTTNYYTIFSGYSEGEKMITIDKGLLQYNSKKELSACIEMKDLLEIARVTDDWLYCYTVENKRDYLCRIPLKKTKTGEEVLLNKMEKLILIGDYLEDIVYLDDACVVYRKEKVNKNKITYMWLRYDMIKKTCQAVEGIKQNIFSHKMYCGNFISHIVVQFSGEQTNYFYYNPYKRKMCKLPLDRNISDEEKYDGDGMDQLWGVDNRLYYYRQINAFNQYPKKAFDVYCYDGGQNRPRKFISHDQIEKVLKTNGLWEKGMVCYVTDIMQGEGKIYLSLAVERMNKKICENGLFVLSCSEENSDDLTYEKEISEWRKGKGDKEIYQDKWGNSLRDMDGDFVFLHYPYMADGYLSEVYDMETGKIHAIGEDDISDWYYQMANNESFVIP